MIVLSADKLSHCDIALENNLMLAVCEWTLIFYLFYYCFILSAHTKKNINTLKMLNFDYLINSYLPFKNLKRKQKRF